MSAPSVDYLLRAGLQLGRLEEALAPSFGLLQDPLQTREAVYYDSFDGRLHRAGLTLMHTDRRLVATSREGRETTARVPVEAPEHLMAGDLPVGPLRDLVAPILDVRAASRLVRIQRRMRPLRVLDERRKTVVRLVVDEPRLVGRPPSELTSRVTVTGVRGYDKAQARVRRLLETGLGLPPAPNSLLEEAVAAAGATPGGVRVKVRVPLDAEDRADVAVARLLRGLLDAIEVNMPGTLADVDSEFLHDLRVAVRRSRALQREARRALPPEPLARLRNEFRWLQAVTGPTRDLDVSLLDFESFRAAIPGHGADLEPLRQTLIDRRRRERTRMVRALRSERTSALLRDWSAFLAGVEGADGPSPGSIRALADERITRVYRKMVKAGRAIGDESPPEALHDLRKQGKELRYLLEFFAGLYPSATVRPMVRSLKALQDTLGRYQDREVQADMIRSLADEIATRDGGAAALMAMGLLADRLTAQQVEARAEFAERFAAFAAKEQRALVRETFA